jgi:hypothetical protein
VAYDPDDSGDYVQTQKTYLDDLEIYDPELGCVVPAWKSLILRGALLKNRMIGRNDSAGAVAAEAAKTASGPKLPPPLVADSAKDKATQTKLQSALDALGRLETRLDLFEQRRAEEAECTRRAEAALALAEEIAEQAPEGLMDALPSAPPNRRLN